MSKKTNDTHTPFNKGMAKVLSATMAAASVVSVLPANIANADVASALAAINAAATDAEMQAALTAPDLGLNLTGYQALSPGGQTAVANELITVRGAGYADQAAVQTALNSAVATQQNAEALTAAVAAVNSAADASAMRTALESANLGLILTSYNLLSSTGKDVVADAVLAARPGGGYADKAAIQTALNDAVTARADAESLTTAIANVNGAGDATAIRAALESPYLGLILTSYSALSEAGKNSVAVAVLAARPGGGFGTQADIQNALNTAVTTAANEEALANAVAAVNGAADNAAMRVALEAANLGLVLTTYNALSEAGKNNVAATVKAGVPGGGYADKTAIQNAFNAAVTTEFNAEASVSAIAAVNSAADAAALRTALESATLGLVLSTYNTLSDAGKNIVASAVLAARPGGGFADKMSIQDAVNTAVSAQANAEAFQAAIAAVNNAPDSAQMRTALESATLGLVLTTYGGLSDGGKTNVAAAVLAARPGGGYADKTAIQNALNSAVTTEQNAEVIAAAIAAVNSASDAASMQTALESATLGLILNSFNNLGADGKTNVATAMIAVRPGGGFADKAAIQSALNSQVTAEANREALAAPLAVVNAAGDATAMKSALEAPDLALDLTSYYQLNPTHKAAAAAAVLAARPGGGYASQPSVQVALNAAVATETIAQAVEVVNNASDAASMKSALTSTKLGLTLTAYNGLSNADKTAVAGLVLAAVGGGFADQAAVQSALDAAIAGNAPMAAVNQAVNAAAMETALEDAALGLIEGVYATWNTADQAAVAEAVRTARPADGYVDVNSVQTAFDSAVTARTPVANVNLAVGEASMQTALEDGTLGLTLGAYSTWAVADKAAVVNEVLANRPVGGYADLAAIQTAFNTALTARTLLAVVNAAATAGDMQTALEDAALGLSLGAYSTWTAADKVDVAVIVLGGRPVDGFVDLNDLQTTVDAAVAMRSFMAAVNIATTAADMKTALEDPMLFLNLSSYSTWSDADKLAVATTILANRPVGGYMDSTAVQTAFDAALTVVAPLANVNAAATAGDMEAALEAAALGLTLSAEYAALGDQTAVAQWVLDNRPAGGYADVAAVQAALDLAVALQYVNIAANATDMQTALESAVLALNFGTATAWGVADKAAIADAVRTSRGAGYLTVAAVQAALDAAIVARTAVADVNNAGSNAAMQTALEAGALGLDLSTYNAYTASDKAAVAATVFGGRPADGYADLTAVQTALDAAVAMRSFMAAVNTAASAAAMEAALEDVSLGLTLGTYAGWSTADQAAVAATVLAARPAGGYADETAVQSAFDAAVAVRTAMAAVNSAADTTAMQTALEDASLALTFGAYASYTDADKAAVADAVLAGRPAGGYVDQNEVQTAFDAAVAIRSFMAAVNTAATAAEMQTALEEPSLGLTLGAYSSYTNADKEAVVAAVLAGRPGSGYADQTEVQTAFDAAVAIRSFMAAVNTAASAAAMETALEDVSLGLTLGAYAGWTAADQAAVAATVLAARPAGGYADAAAVQSAFDTAVTARTAMAAVNSAASTAAMQVALEDAALALTLGAYAGWSTSDKAAVVTDVLAGRPGSGYADHAAVQAAFDAALTARTSVAAVNSAADGAAMQTALEDATLALTLGAYAGWSTADKAAVVTDVLVARPVTGYTDQAAIQTAFDAAVTARVAVAAVNSAVDATSLQPALENVALGLDLTAYNLLSTADKTTVVGHVFANRPVGGFVDTAAVQLALDSAITADAPMAAVNNAWDAASMETALENLALGLTLGGYNSWSQADQTAVATAVLAGRPGTGYANLTDLQSAFDAAVAMRLGMAAVNSAADASSLEAALEDALLGLTLGAYAGWSVADQAAVATDVLNARPVGGYADLTELQTAFDAAVAIRTAVAAVNSALDATGMKAALEDGTLGLTLGAYAGWTAADQEAVAATVFANRPATGYVDLASLQTAFDTAVAERTALAAVNNAVDEASLQTALEDPALSLVLGVYTSWSTNDKVAVAAAVLAGRPGAGYADLNGLQTAFDAAVAMRTSVAAVNSAADASAIELALEDAALGLTLGAYAGWSAADQAAVAAAVLAVRPAGGFADTTAIQTAFDTAVTSRTAMAAVNSAVDATAMEAALEDGTLGLTLGAYTGWATADQAAVAATVLGNRPVSGYADLAAIQQAFDDAFSARVPLAGLNLTADAGAMLTALADPALSIDLGVLTGWSTADQTAVATELLTNRPADGYMDLASLQNTFDGIVALRVPVAAVNSALGPVEIETALEDAALGLTLGAYASWSQADQAAVAGDVWMARPAGGFADLAAVQAAFDAAVATRGAVAAVNTALTGADMRAALENVALGLDLTFYNSLGALDRTLVADLMVLERPDYGYEDQAHIQAYLDGMVDLLSLDRDRSTLAIGYGLGDSASQVTQDLTLPTTGFSGSTITWSSDSLGVIGTNGTVTRPAFLSGDAVVVLTATLEKNGLTLTKEFVVKVLKQAATDLESVTTAKHALEVGYQAGDSASGVTQNLDLASMGSFDTTVTWSSDNNALIAADGTVTRPTNAEGDQVVTLTATITKGVETTTKTFVVKVLKQAQTDAEAVTNAKAALSVGYAAGDAATAVTQDLTLATTGADGTSITWSSDNPALIAADGTVTRPANSAGDAVVVLTATITKNGAETTKTFVVKVLKQAVTDAEAVESAAAALTVGYAAGDSASYVTQNLTLPTTGDNGTTVTWSSDNIGVITPNGAVIRPYSTQGDQVVTLTATISKNGVTTTKTFVVKVVKQAQTDGEAIEIAWHHLQIGYAPSETEFDVTQNIMLPTAGAEGTAITWASGNTAVIAADGTVTRPDHATGNVTVTLTATITKGAAITQKTFNVTVLANAPIPVTPAPLAANIVVTNNPAGATDTVYVNGLQTGDLVTVYAADGTTKLAEGTVLPGSVSATLQISQLGTTGGNVKVTVTRPGHLVSAPVTKVFAAENAKPYSIENGILNRASGIKATVTIQPTEGMVVSGNKYVVFELMNGTTPEGIIVLQYNSQTAEQLTAHFNKPNNANYKVKVFVVDGYGSSIGDVGNTLATPVTLQ